MLNVSAYQSEDLRGHNSSQSGPESTARHPYIPKTKDVKMLIVNTDLSEHRMNTSTVYNFLPVLFPPLKDQRLIHQVLNSPSIQFCYIILFK